MVFGYARVSTSDQNLENQVALLNEDGCKEIHKEKISGAKKSRPELEKLLEQFIVWVNDLFQQPTLA